MNTTCLGCGVLIPAGVGGRCRRCSPKRIRSSRAWTEMSRAARAAGVCAGCGRTVAAANLDAHHPIRVVDRLDLALAQRPIPLCHACHEAQPR